MKMKTAPRILGLVYVTLTAGLVACANGEGAQCTTVAECGAGERCVDGRCVSGRREDGGVDAGPLDAGRDASDDAEPERDGGVDAGPPPGPCGLEPCAIWTIAPAETAWSAYPAIASALAPTSPVRAAFDVESIELAYVLTDTTYHVLRLADRTWVEAGNRDLLFPEAAGAALNSAFSIPAGYLGGNPDVEPLSLSSAGSVYQYQMTLPARLVAFTNQVDERTWEPPFAPDPALVRFSWTAAENPGWAAGDPNGLCGEGPPMIEGYAAFATSTDVHIYEGQHCFEFASRTPIGDFAPFRRLGAPPIARIGAAFWNAGRLWILAE
ncbi:MAG: hypothetical protein KF901_15595 [Myxococcales bacterium]|nr:hypothetical protein [Myxococcales bacterium]